MSFQLLEISSQSRHSSRSARALFLGFFLLVFGIRNYRRNGPPPANPLAQKMARDPALFENDDLGDEDKFLGDSPVGDQRV